MKPKDQRDWDRQQVMSMVRFCAKVAAHQVQRGKFFILENPKESAIWYTHCMQDLRRLGGVTWNELHFCAYGMKDPVSNDYYNKPTCLMHNFIDDFKGFDVALAPLWKLCPNIVQGRKVHNHETVQGWCKGHGQRSKLSQVYPYKFCSTLAELLAKFLGVRVRNQSTYLLEDILDDCLEPGEIAALEGAPAICAEDGRGKRST